MWKSAEQKWELIGEVQGAADQPPQKKMYEGDEYFPQGMYDYIFSVEDDSGIPKKLPFNNDENPMLAAEKYCVREGIRIEMAQQVRQFLMQNTLVGKQFEQNLNQQRNNAYQGLLDEQ